MVLENVKMLLVPLIDIEVRGTLFRSNATQGALLVRLFTVLLNLEMNIKF